MALDLDIMVRVRYQHKRMNWAFRTILSWGQARVSDPRVQQATPSVVCCGLSPLSCPVLRNWCCRVETLNEQLKRVATMVSAVTATGLERCTLNLPIQMEQWILLVLLVRAKARTQRRRQHTYLDVGKVAHKMLFFSPPSSRISFAHHGHRRSYQKVSTIIRKT